MSKSNINKMIRALIVSDFFLFFSTGLLAPIFAVFILNNIENKIEIIGFAVSSYWLTRVVTVVPFSRLMDKMKGELVDIKDIAQKIETNEGIWIKLVYRDYLSALIS